MENFSRYSLKGLFSSIIEYQSTPKFSVLKQLFYLNPNFIGEEFTTIEFLTMELSQKLTERARAADAGRFVSSLVTFPVSET